MVNRPHIFKDRDIKRIVKSIEVSTGQKARRVEVDPRTGWVVVEVGDATAPVERNEWDGVDSDVPATKMRVR